MTPLLLLCSLLCLPAALAAPPAAAPLEQAQRLERDGRKTDAFLAYLKIPGAEYLAARLARAEPDTFLALLQAQNAPSPAAKLVEGDLWLWRKQSARALACYQAAAAMFSRDQAASDSYPVEPPGPAGAVSGYAPLALPYTLGPGSQQDNWLLRRFLALGAWDDAAREWERLWTVHRAHAGPFVLVEPETDDQGRPTGRERRSLVTPAGFDGRGLQFAVEYAYFLKRRGQTEQARAVLLEPLRVMDMDRNPNGVPRGVPLPAGTPVSLPERRPPLFRWSSPWAGPIGLSRKEFIRLAYGEFKAQGQEPALVSVLQRQIDGGANRARRVLARVRLHQGREEDTRALELAYIQTAGFDPLSAAARRGLVNEDFRKPAEAIADDEQALALPFVPPNLPDADEEAVENRFARQIVLVEDTSPPGRKIQFRAQLVARLQRLLAGQGRTNRVLELTEQQFAEDPARAEDLDTLAEAAARFRAAGQETQWVAWVKTFRAGAGSAGARAGLSWVIGDTSGAAAALGQAARSLTPYTLGLWESRFRAKGKEPLRAFLTAVVAADPGEARLRLELLDLEGRPGGREAIAALEDLLASQERARSGDPFLLAYRLMRAYEKTGQRIKLEALGLRIARGSAPFAYPDPSQLAWRGENGVLEEANACLALAVQYAGDAGTQARLAQALHGSPWAGARALIARRRRAGVPPPPVPAPPWAALPPGVRLLVSGENVLSLCGDSLCVYAGQPWGVTVYSLTGKPLRRIALGQAAMALAVAGKALWVGTPVGLYRIALPAGPVSFLPGDQDLSAPERRDPDRRGVFNGVCALAARGDDLWIGTRRDVRVFHLKTGSLRIFSAEDLHAPDGRDWTRFLFDGHYVWADGESGCRRYDPGIDRWAAPAGPDRWQPVRLIGLIDGQVWGHVWLNDALRDRPCLLDRATLQVTPVLIAGSASPGQDQFNGPFCFYGRLQGQLVFGPEYPAFVFDAATRTLRPLAEQPGDGPAAAGPAHLQSPIPGGLRSGFIWRQPDGVLVCDNIVTHDYVVGGKPFSAEIWRLLQLPDGTMALAGSRLDSPRYQYPGEDGPFGDETPEGSGGLHFLTPQGVWRHISDTPDALRGDNVLTLIPDDSAGRLWLGTNGGLSVLDGSLRVRESFSRANGLCANQVSGGAALDGKLYFATAWGDSGGGLAVYDPKTGVFTSLTRSDGLATDRLASVTRQGRRLKITYGLEYRRYGDGRSQRYPPAEFDPAAGTFSPPRPPQIVTSFPSASPRVPMPYLGGYLLRQTAYQGRTLLCGTRGLVILEPSARRAAPAVPLLSAPVIPDPRRRLLADAAARPLSVQSPEDLARALRDPNPFRRADALAAALQTNEWGTKRWRSVLPPVAAQVADPELRVRTTALSLLSRVPDEPLVVRALEAGLQDPESAIRQFSTVALLRHGHVPPLSFLREILAEPGFAANFPFGATSNIGVQSDPEQLYEAAAPLADAGLFALLLEYPPSPGDYEFRKTVFPALGAALVRHPDAASLLLRAYGPGKARGNPIGFAREVFHFAGRPLLPLLHQALTSQDRIVRSNAALACGAIGDPSSIPFLIQALDLESGLSRASVVQALGELKAREALPQLVALYTDAANDEKRRAGSGFRIAQQAAVLQAQYESLSSLDAVGAEWDELKAAGRPDPIDPEGRENLLRPEGILEAVRRIGPAASQEFYRALAGASDAQARGEAAVQLAECGPTDRARNLVILRALLGDQDETVRMGAAVSLLLLGQTDVQPAILEWLNAPDRWVEGRMLDQLARVTDPARRAFARPRIQAIAADPALDESLRPAVRRLLAP